MTFFDNFQSPHLIAAHRGYRAYYPENTIAAFMASIGRCHFIELDVQLSRDYVPVIIHDQTLERTTDAAIKCTDLGVASQKVWDWNLHQLKTLDVGSWFFTSDPFGTVAEKTANQNSTNHSQTIATLEEVLLITKLKNIPINIEIKDHKGWQYNQKVTESVLNVVKKTRSQNRVLISSFNHDYLVITKKCAPEVSTAALENIRHHPTLIDYLSFLGVSAYHPSDAIATPDLIRQLRTAGIGVNVYTVNNRKRQQQLFKFGATAIFTDYPELPADDE